MGYESWTRTRKFLDRAEVDQIAILTALDESNTDWFARLKYLTIYGYCTSELGMRELKALALPWRYDGCAPYDRL